MNSSTSFSLAGPIEKLSTTNYRKWSRSIRNYLIINKLWSYVDGTNPQPEDDKGKVTWSSEDQRVIAMISQTIEDSFQDCIVSCTTSKVA